MSNINVTKEEFMAYEALRRSGVVNMWSPDVEDLAGISRETKVEIMKHYEELCAKWPDIRKLKEGRS